MTIDPVQLCHDLRRERALDADPRLGTRELAATALGALDIELLHCKADAVVARMLITEPLLARGLLLVLAETVASTGAGLAVGHGRRAFGAELNASWTAPLDVGVVVAAAVPLVVTPTRHVWRIVAIDAAGTHVLESRCTLGVVDAPT
jgi:uncharacterized protein (TIGR00369 family)